MGNEFHNLIVKELSRSHDPSHEFYGLTMLTRVFFVLFLINFSSTLS